MPPDDFEALSEAERAVFQQQLEETEEELQAIFQAVPRLRKEARDRLKDLDKGVVEAEVKRLIEPIQQDYQKFPAVHSFLEAAAKDIPEQIPLFREDLPSDDDDDDDDGGGSLARATRNGHQGKVEIRRYQVNLLVDHGKTQGAPVIHEDIPAIVNLIGRIEHLAEFGALFTDHTLIKAGAFHLASGGYLVLDAWRLISAPYAWAALKRVLRSKLVRMDGFTDQAHPMSTVMLTPDPIPVDVKVVLMGPPDLYYELCASDPDFERYFKILAAFEDRVPRDGGTTLLLARVIATKLRENGLLPFGRDAVAALIEQSSREADDNAYLSANLASLFNLMDEADFWAREAGVTAVRRVDVDRALEAFERRSSQPRDEQFDQIRREILLIRTSGALVGEINALAVIQLGSYAFGRVSRVSATARAGLGEVMDIEREADMAGSIHAKGVLILQSLLGSRYARDIPLSLAASLTFEQSYHIVDGDSASCAEFCALVSAISEVPIRQSLAVTGAINQRGEVQAVGGLNAKIEGFFDICAMRGLTGVEGVILPRANIKHLMLKASVVEAVRAGQFNLWAVGTADEALELLTGLPMGERLADGSYPPESLNGRVEAQLRHFLEVRRKLHNHG
jgi:lon-related putative ATP-dependent protease